MHLEARGFIPVTTYGGTAVFDLSGRKKREPQKLIAEHEKRGAERKALELQLRCVAAEGGMMLIEQLVKMGVNVNAQDPETGRTALMIAVNYDHRSAAVSLLSYGANIHIKAHNGRSAVDIAETKGQADLAALMREVHQANEEYRKPKPDAF